MAEIALITGAARRIGAQIARHLHKTGFKVVLHYRSSATEANRLRDELNEIRNDSAVCLEADLTDTKLLPRIVRKASESWGGLHVLINNASTFYPTPLASARHEHWSEIMDCNLKAPFFLIQAAVPFLELNTGCIINITDIYAERPLKDHPVYCISKAGLDMLTLSFAKELAPRIRVNGVAPGAIMWPENRLRLLDKNQILERIPLQRSGVPEDIAKTVLFLIRDAPYVTGQILVVDGGRSLFG